jgi:sporulation protein YlmC with PRC-barrel domain
MRVSFAMPLALCGLLMLTTSAISNDVEHHATQTNGAAVRATDLMKVAVYNTENEKLGKIEDLVIDSSSGKIRYGVLSFGGFLGMGEKLFAVPWASLQMAPKSTASSAGTVREDYYVLDVSKDALKNAPGFDKKSWPDFADPNFTAKIEAFYSSRAARTSSGQAR